MEKLHALEMSISHTRYFNSLRDLADFLDIKNASRKAIESRCRVYGYEIKFDD